MNMAEEKRIKKAFQKKVASLFGVAVSSLKEVHFERDRDGRNCKGSYRIGDTGRCEIFGDAVRQSYDTRDTRGTTA